jgi:hypothetical protein
VFHTRCPKYRDQLSDGERERCRIEEPVLEEKRPGQSVYCHFAEVRSDLIDGEAPGPRSTGIREVIRKTAAGAPGTGVE